MESFINDFLMFVIADDLLTFADGLLESETSMSKDCTSDDSVTCHNIVIIIFLSQRWHVQIASTVWATAQKRNVWTFQLCLTEKQDVPHLRN